MHAASLAGAAILLLAAALLPVDGVVEGLAARFNTVRAFRGDFARGLQLLRLALAANGLLLALLPLALRRAKLVPGRSIRPERPDLLTAGGLWALTALLALPGLFESFQDDEWRVLEQYIRHGPLVILSRSSADNHLLQSLLSWPFVALLGISEVAVRLPVYLLTPFAPVLLFALLRREHPRGPAFAGALPLAVSPFLLQYASEGRGYGPLLASVLGLILLREPLAAGSRRAWIASSLLGAAAVLFHLFAAPVVAALAIPFRKEDRAPERAWRLGSALAISAALAFLVSAPTLPQVVGYGAGRPDGVVPSDRGPLFALAETFSFPFPALLALALVPAFACSPRSLVPALVAAGLQAALIAVTHAGHAPRFYVASVALAWVAVGAGAAAGFASRK
ncbi:MAG TPA: glycosyltransferase family 39 protein, partial [Planctomycetota bacterium]|nr:glycosyltransferase family 39 protein [Planctomycetota bacterium]